MLVKCPRCGFQQPQDKYCAQCGVDMETYRRPPPPLYKKIFGNPATQITAVLLLALVVGFSLYNRQRSDLEDRVSYLKNGPQVARSLSSPSSAPSEDISAPQEPPQAAVAAVAPPTTLKTPAPTTTLAVTAKTAGHWKVKLVVAEIAKPALDQLFNESAATGQFNRLGDYVAGIIPDLQRKLGGRDLKILSQLTKNVDNGQSVQIFQGLHQGDADDEIGLTYFIELQEGEGGIERGNLEVLRSWREAPPGASGPITTQRKTFPAVFELSKGSGFFMSSFLPRLSLLENEEELVSTPPFQILRSNGFRAGLSDAILFIEFDKD